MSTPMTMATATVTGCGHAAALPLLHQWRAPEMLPQDSIVYRLLRALVKEIAVLGEPGWPAAAAGDAPEAVRLALRASRNAVAAPLTVNLAGTALLLCAVDGSETASATLRYLRSRLTSPASTLHNGLEA